MRRTMRRRLPVMARLLVAAMSAGLLSTSAAQATTQDATWSGGDSTFNWSAAGNWSGTAPGQNATLGTLTFPYLGTACAPSSNPTSACYMGGETYGGVIDDLGTITANKLMLDSSQNYVLLPGTTGTNTLQLNGDSNNVGLEAVSGELGFALPYIGIPITLGGTNAQTWDLNGGGNGVADLTVDSVTGTSPLTLQLSNDGQLSVTTLDTGALTINGSGGVYVVSDANNDQPVLPAAGVTLPDGTTDSQPSLNIEAPAVTSGPIDASAGVLYGNQVSVGAGYLPEASLAVSGDVNLGPGTAFGFSIDGNDTGTGVDSSDMTVNGSVSLDGARLGMSQGSIDTNTNDCVSLTPGNTYTLLTTTGGTISGTMHYWDGTGYDSSVDEGQTSATPTPFGQNCRNGTAAEAFIHYGSTAITETIAGAPTLTGPPSLGGSAEIGQTLTATHGTWEGYPAPSYTYQWMACTSGNCSPIGGATDSTFVVTSAQEGDTIEVQVTATNSVGNASATSNATGSVPTPTPTPTTTTPTTTTPATTTPTTTTATTASPTPTLPSATQVRAALGGVGHPASSKAIKSLIKTRSYKTSFTAPSAGAVSIVWTTVVTTGRGNHKKRRTVTVATGSGTAASPGKLTVTIHLTAAGRTLLKPKPHDLHITATEKFQPGGGSWIIVVKHFTL